MSDPMDEKIMIEKYASAVMAAITETAPQLDTRDTWQRQGLLLAMARMAAIVVGEDQEFLGYFKSEMARGMTPYGTTGQVKLVK